MASEVEIRAVVDNPDLIKCRLVILGYRRVESYDQHDIMFDRPDGSLFKSGQKIRLRYEKGAGELTYKGQFEGSDAASRRAEISFAVEPSAREQVFLFFQALGYPFLFQIRKRREVFGNEDVKVTFDDWPIIGCLVELEGREDKIKALAKSIAPELEFKNYRLRELFRKKERDAGLSLSVLQAKYEADTGFSLGRLDLLLD